MKTDLVTVLVVGGVSLASVASGQTTRVWSSDSDQRWSVNANWTSANRPNAANETAEFGTGLQTNPQLNNNSYTVRGINFSADALGYNVGDDNGARTLGIGNASSGFITQLSANDQTISIGTLALQSATTVTNSGAGSLTISSAITGANSNLTFDATGDITVSGAIGTGGGRLTKTGGGTLTLSGANSYTGATTISAGTLRAGAAGIFSDTGLVTINSNGTLDLNGMAETVGRVSGGGEIFLGTLGNGVLSLNSGTSNFAGSFGGSGRLVIGAGATLTLGAGFTNTGLNITLAGGTLNLNGADINFGALDVTGNSIIDFSSSAASRLSATSLGFSGTGLQLTVHNWTDQSDFFFTQAGYDQGSAPLDQVIFSGWAGSDTKWVPYDASKGQVTPVPEAPACGAWLLLVGAAMVARQRAGRRRAVGHRATGSALRRTRIQLR